MKRMTLRILGGCLLGSIMLSGCSGLFPLREDSDASTYQSNEDPREPVDDGAGNLIMQENTSKKTVYICTSSVNVRSAAGMSGQVIGELTSGEEVEVEDADGDWYKIDYNGETGYVYNKYLEEKDASDTEEESQQKSSSPYDSDYDGIYGE